jgi:hypothetical protein
MIIGKMDMSLEDMQCGLSSRAVEYGKCCSTRLFEADPMVDLVALNREQFAAALAAAYDAGMKYDPAAQGN